MRRILLFAAVLAGCQTGRDLVDDTFVNRYYYRDGYKVQSIHGNFIHREEKNEDTLRVGQGFRAKQFVDKGCDGEVDTVRIIDEFFHRTDPGVEEVFENADRDYAYWKERFRVTEVEAAWREKTQWEIARDNYYREDDPPSPSEEEEE